MVVDIRSGTAADVNLEAIRRVSKWHFLGGAKGWGGMRSSSTDLDTGRGKER